MWCRGSSNVVDTGAHIVLATSKPASLLPMYLALGALARIGRRRRRRRRGLEPAAGRRSRRRTLRWVDGVAVVTDGQSLCETRGPEAAAEWLFLVPRPAVVIADGPYADAALEAGVEVVALAGLDHCSLAVERTRAALPRRPDVDRPAAWAPTGRSSRTRSVRRSCPTVRSAAGCDLQAHHWLTLDNFQPKALLSVGAGGGEREFRVGHGLSKARFLTVQEVANLMRVSSMTVYRLIKSGDLPAVRVAGRSASPKATSTPISRRVTPRLGNAPTDGRAFRKAVGSGSLARVSTCPPFVSFLTDYGRTDEFAGCATRSCSTSRPRRGSST